MASRSTPRLVAIVALMIFGSTVGSRDPAAAVVPSASSFASSIEVEKTSLPLVTGIGLTELIDSELARQYDDRLAVWLEAERAQKAAELDALWAQWILDVDAQIQRRTGRYLPWPTVAWIIDAATRHGVDPVLVGKIGACESGGRAEAYNPSGASGFGQHLAMYWPARAAGAGYPGASPFDLWVNIEVTAWYLARAGTSPWAPSRHCWS